MTPNAYRSGVLQALDDVLRRHRCVAESALDFGAGDGWYANSLEASGLCRQIDAVDVVDRKQALRSVRIYDGKRLPANDRAYDLVYAIDVLHHCADPEQSLRDLARCSRRWLLLKDHTYQNFRDWAALALMDELGNRRFGIPSPRHYQRDWRWDETFRKAGFELVERTHPVRVDPRWVGRWTSHLQFVALWRRTGDET